jgi:hypothetical protein
MQWEMESDNSVIEARDAPALYGNGYRPYRRKQTGVKVMYTLHFFKPNSSKDA